LKGGYGLKLKGKVHKYGANIDTDAIIPARYAPLAIKAAGISCVITKSFARIFFRNAINIGLPLLECIEAVDGTETGDILEVDLITGEIRNITRDKTFTAKAYPDFMMEIINAGGLVEYTTKKLTGGL
jgi:3-isopropylmalate/(R)-2-methylmalate dehydratase small subunit